MSANAKAVISIRDLVVGFGDAVVLKGVTLDVNRGEILGVVGGSGGGKTVLMRTIIGLLPRRGGSIETFGIDREKRQRTSSAPFSGGGASCSSKARCSPRSPRGRMFSFPCGNTSSCQNG